MKKQYRAPRGTRDILPEEVPRWQFVERCARSVFERYGFSELRTPILESTELFARSVGESSDIVQKEMYTIERGDDSLTLRPENTASVVRAFVEHGLYRGVASGFPERFYYIGPMFRHERPQKGRQRQFHQIGAEVLGSAEPIVDAEMIQMLELFLNELGIERRKLLIASVGDERCRPGYRESLKAWLAPRLDSLCGDCRRRYEENPLRVLDCKVDRDREILRDAPLLGDHLCQPCAEHFSEVRRLLDGYGIAYTVEPRLVRGLDYYERTVFEVVAGGLGAQNAVLGGGRYDGLVEELGGPSIPGIGFAMGVERALLGMPPDVASQPSIDVVLIPLGPQGWEACVSMARRFRERGLRVHWPTRPRPMGAQLRRVDRIGARFALFVGESELAEGRFGLKDLQSGEQQTLDESAILRKIGERDV